MLALVMIQKSHFHVSRDIQPQQTLTKPDSGQMFRSQRREEEEAETTVL